jgi:ABC-2 type transport system permease protein
MTAPVVARKEFRDGLRSRLVWVLVAVFGLLAVGSSYYFAEVAPPGGEGDPTTVAVLVSMAFPVIIVLPVVATMVGYKAVVGERESGSLRFLLGLPHSRRDVLLGKFVGRTGVVTVSLAAGLLVGGLTLAVLLGGFAVVDYLLFALVTVLLGATFVSVAVTFSTVVRSSSVATAAAIALVLLFVFLWELLVSLVRIVGQELGLYAPADGVPPAIQFLSAANPTNAFLNAVTAVVETGGESTADAPVYLQDWFGFIVLLAWLVVPLGVALHRFQRTDL